MVNFNKSENFNTLASVLSSLDIAYLSMQYNFQYGKDYVRELNSLVTNNPTNPILTNDIQPPVDIKKECLSALDDENLISAFLSKDYDVWSYIIESRLHALVDFMYSFKLEPDIVLGCLSNVDNDDYRNAVSKIKQHILETIKFCEELVKHYKSLLPN